MKIKKNKIQTRQKLYIIVSIQQQGTQTYSKNDNSIK